MNPVSSEFFLNDRYEMIRVFPDASSVFTLPTETSNWLAHVKWYQGGFEAVLFERRRASTPEYRRSGFLPEMVGKASFLKEAIRKVEAIYNEVKF